MIIQIAKPNLHIEKYRNKIVISYGDNISYAGEVIPKALKIIKLEIEIENGEELSENTKSLFRDALYEFLNLVNGGESTKYNLESLINYIDMQRNDIVSAEGPRQLESVVTDVQFKYSWSDTLVNVGI